MGLLTHCARCMHEWHGLDCIFPLTSRSVFAEGKDFEDYRSVVCGCSPVGWNAL